MQCTLVYIYIKIRIAGQYAGSKLYQYVVHIIIHM